MGMFTASKPAQTASKHTEPQPLENTMVRPVNTNRPNAQASVVRTVVVSALGLLPMGIVSGMMLMQMLGIWTY